MGAVCYSCVLKTTKTTFHTPLESHIIESKGSGPKLPSLVTLAYIYILNMK